MTPLRERILICLMMIPESIYYLNEVGIRIKQEDYIWPIAGKATVHDKVFIVCDGDGSFYHGGIASKLVCEFMAAKVLKFSVQKISGELIDKLLTEARDRLINYAREYRLDTDLATTFSMLSLYDQKVLISWYGDSRIYHLRGGEILFRTEGNSLYSEPIKNTTIARGIKADSSPIYAETKWIEDVQGGDYFLLCSKGFIKSVMDDDIKLLVSQNDEAMIDLTGSFRRLAFEKTADNYSMYLIKVNEDIKKRGIKSGIISIFILPLAIIAMLITIIYFPKARTSHPTREYRNQTSQPVDVLRNDSVRGAIVMSSPRKSILPVTDSIKKNGEDPQTTPQNDSSANIQIEEKPEQTNQTAIGQKVPVAQLLIKFTTDESCKLKITNMNLDEVIDWDLSQNDNASIYLKPGKYSIVATSVISSSKSKTYNFDVKPGHAHTTQNLHIRF
jgi:PPM family protein phosphatase